MKYAFIIWSTVAVLAFLPRLYRRLILPRRPVEVRAAVARRDWEQGRRAAGLDPEQLHAEAAVLRALATIQEHGSAAVYRNDGDIDAQVQALAEVEVQALHFENPDLAKALTRVLDGTRKEELMFPDALAELERQYQAGERARPADWSPVRQCPGKRPDEAELRRRAEIELSAFTVR